MQVASEAFTLLAGEFSPDIMLRIFATDGMNCHGAVPHCGGPNPHCFQSFSQPQIP